MSICTNIQSHISQRYVLCIMCYGVLFVCVLQIKIFEAALEQIIVSPPKIWNDSDKYCPSMMSSREFNYGYTEKYQLYWPSNVENELRQCFYIGYIIFLIPAGMTADFYGGKTILGWGFLASSIIGMLYPSLFKVGRYAVMIGRLFQGVGQGVVMPSITSLFAVWIPQTERSTFVSLMVSAAFSGSSTAFWISLFSIRVRESWDVQLYFGGILGLIWCLPWYLLVYNSPNVCPNITVTERNHLRKNIEGFVPRRRNFYTFVPWKKMFISSPTLSLLLFNISSSWMYYTIADNVISYTTKAVNLTRALASICYAVSVSAIVVSSVIWGMFSDWLINHEVIARTSNRKWFGFCSYTLTAPFIYGAFIAGCNGAIVFALFTCMYYVLGIGYFMYVANCIDMSPQHAGLLYSIVEYGTALPCLFHGEVSRFIADSYDNPDQWRKLYTFSFIIFVTGSLPYLWWGSAEIQNWNYLRQPFRLRSTVQIRLQPEESVEA